MLKRKQIVMIAVLLVSACVCFFIFASQKEKTKNQKPEIPKNVPKETKRRMSYEPYEPKEVVHSEIQSAGYNSSSDFELTLLDVPLEEIGQKSVELTRNLYRGFSDMDFSEAIASELVFVRDGKPGSDSPGYYISVLRNSHGEIIARTILSVTQDKGSTLNLETGNVEPFPPAFTDQKVQAAYRKGDKYPLKEPFPLITEDKANEIIRSTLYEPYIFNGLTSLYVYLPAIENYYQVGSWFAPYYQFSQLGSEDKKVWVNCETGVVIDLAYLDSEIDRFESDSVQQIFDE